MFDRLLDDARLATGRAARQTFFVVAAGASLFVTTGFLSAAAFIFVMQRYGLIYACLTGAAIFFAVTLVSAGCYASLKSSGKARVKEDAKPAATSFLPDPMMLATGLQVARAIGFKRILPILAIAGVALGALAARGFGSDETGDSSDDT